MRILVCSGNQVGRAKFVQASTTMTWPLVQMMLNPNRFIFTPKLAPLACTYGFHNTVGRPLNVGPQPVVPAK